MCIKSVNMQEEIWKDIPNYEGFYQASSLGNIKSLSRKVKFKHGVKTNKERILKPALDSVGYLSITLSRYGKTKSIRVHYLVAITFLNHKRCGYSKVVDHINNIKSDNRANNLQIISQRQNSSKVSRGVSKYVGVHFNKKKQKWCSLILINRNRKSLGYFNNEYEAHLAYQEALKKFQGKI